MLDVARTKKLVDQCWADEIVPTFVEYIKIPNKSPSFDPDWAAHGYMDEPHTLTMINMLNLTHATSRVRIGGAFWDGYGGDSQPLHLRSGD